MRIVLYSLLLLPSVGQSKESDDAKSQFLEGAAHFREGRYSDAYEAFKASYRKKPVLTALYNIAMCAMVLGHYVESLESFKKLLKEGGPKLKPDLRQKASESIEKLNSLVGTLRLKDPPSDANLQIDGVPVDGRSIDHPVLLNPGVHDIRVTQEGHTTFETQIVIASGSTVIVQAHLPKVENRAAPATPNANGELNQKKTPRTSPTHSEAPVFEKKPSRRFSGWFIGGLSFGIAGLIGIGVGGIFTYNQYKNSEDARAAEKKLDIDGDYDAYSRTYTQIRDIRVPQADLGMKIGYISGGALAVTGLVLISVDLIRGRGGKEQSRIVHPTLQGVVIAF